MNGRNGGNAKEIAARLDTTGSVTGKSRPDFKAAALLWTVHRSFGRSAFLVPESPLTELSTSELRNLRSPFMQRSSKRSFHENLRRSNRDVGQKSSEFCEAKPIPKPRQKLLCKPLRAMQ